MLVNNIVESFLIVLSESNKIDVDRMEELERKSLEANQGLKPTIDCHGRLHAPCNGYQWGEDIYPAGAYLSNEYDCKHVQDEKTRFKTSVETVTLLKGAIKSLNFSTGKSWGDSGIEVCYCYVTGLSKTQLKRIEELTKELEAALKSKIVSNRVSLEVGKQDLIVTVISSFTKFNYYSNDYDLKLNLLVDNKTPVIVNVTNKIWDLVNDSIDELINKKLSLVGTIKDLGENTYQVNRPSKIKLV